ncbi:flagellar export protein FliJ [Alteribacter populi]|uniref:flagellar export protein FliJ n=1 Tax=Alteribacter populi TaxID=2011011 RepID=UPI0012FE56F9|nr:flagellar export protein FliJ [Alteribacter populi]
MSFTFSLQKVLELKEHERNQADEAWNEATSEFEEVAMELYHLLKQKEEMENDYHGALEKGISISHLQHYQTRLSDLERIIHRSQKETQRARAKMQSSEHKRTLRAVDVKKYEKVKQKKQEQYASWQKANDMKSLDEIAVQQFMWK